MLAYAIEIGPNLLVFALAVVAGGPTLATIVFGRRAANAASSAAVTAEATAKQLVNNGGNSALDKLQQGHAALQESQDGIVLHQQATDRRIDQMTAELERLTTAVTTLVSTTATKAP